MGQSILQMARKGFHQRSKVTLVLSTAALLGAVATLSGKFAWAADEFAYIPLQGDHAVSVRDSRTLEPIATVPTDGTSIDSRLTPDSTKLYVINTFNPVVSIIRAKCPTNKDDWSDAERAAGKCVPHSKLGTHKTDDSMSGYFSITRDSKLIYIMSGGPDPAAPPGADPFTSMITHINVVDTRTDKNIKILSPPKGTMAAEISPDGKTLWIATVKGLVQGLDPNTGAPITSTVFVGLMPATIKVSPDGKWLYAANMPPGAGPQADKANPPIATVGVVDTKALKLVKTISMTPGSTITGIEVTGKANQVWTANANNTVTVIDMRSLKIVKTITTPFETAEAVDVSNDGERALVVGFNGKLDPMNPGANFPAFAQLYSTKTFAPIGKLISLGNNSAGIPSLSAE
jgi:DNA-binding beta-propeller fold protein YncE